MGHIFSYDKKSAFEYNMQNLIRLDSPIAKLISTHNNGNAVKLDSIEANWLMSELYLAVGDEVILTSNL